MSQLLTEALGKAPPSVPGQAASVLTATVPVPQPISAQPQAQQGGGAGASGQIDQAQLTAVIAAMSQRRQQKDCNILIVGSSRCKCVAHPLIQQLDRSSQAWMSDHD